MTAITERIDFTNVDVFRLDPYFRDEGGRFATKPEQLPAPVRHLPDARRTELASYSGVAWSMPDDQNRNYWRVRCVRQSDGKWSVIYEDDPKFSA